MNLFFTWLLVGMGLGIVILPVIMILFGKIRDTMQRRSIKRMIKQGQFLITIDPRDYDTNAWKEEIPAGKYEQELIQLNEKIFKKNA